MPYRCDRVNTHKGKSFDFLGKGLNNLRTRMRKNLSRIIQRIGSLTFATRDFSMAAIFWRPFFVYTVFHTFSYISPDLSILKIFNYNPYHYSLMLRFVLLLFQPRFARTCITFTIHMIFPFFFLYLYFFSLLAFFPLRNPVTCTYISLQ